MDVRNLLLGLNGIESEIQRLLNTAFVDADRLDADQGLLNELRRRRTEILDTLDKWGYDVRFIEGSYYITTKQKLEGVDALLSR